MVGGSAVVAGALEVVPGSVVASPVACGRCPDPSVIRAVAAWLETRGSGAPFATDSLPAELPEVAGAKDVASGLLTFTLPGPRPRRLMWFRPEFVETVHWGGDPRKPVEPDPGMRIHPRRSFALWRSEVRLRSRPWTASDLEAAEDLRRMVVEVDLERQVARAQCAIRARDDLVAVVSHDLRNPLSVVQMQSSILLRSALPNDEEPVRRLRACAERIQRAVDHMNALISDLLDLAKIEAGRFCVASYADDPAFICVNDASGDEGQVGDPCQYINGCDPGLACVPACADDPCCSPFCDVGLPNTCPGAPDEVCAPYFGDPPPPGYESVGVCFTL